VNPVTDTTPARVRARFPGISSRAYEHPADRTALVALRRLEGFDTVLRKLAGLFRERSLRLMFLATAVRVGETQFRNVHEMVRDAAYTLDVAEVPEVYVVQDPAVSAMTLGVDRPWIVLSSGALELLDEEELRFVIGHEVGHVLSGHAVYRTMLFHLLRLTRRAVWMPLGYIGLRALVVALEEWFRKSELSCDRAGLLVGQDSGAALRALMKTAGGSRLAEMDTDAFLAQAAEYDAAGDLRDGVAKILQLQGQTHPFAVPRAAELRRWVDAGDYERILGGDYPRRADDPSTSVREEARTAARSYKDKVSESADPLMGLVKDLGEAAAGAGSAILDRIGRPRS
jgi:Zn-dependent protease with chaperone function